MPFQSTIASATPFLITPLFFIFILTTTSTLPSANSSSAPTDQHFLNCSVPTTCGPNNITFPFYLLDHQPSYCGFPGFALSCISDRLYLNFSATGDAQFDTPDHDDYLVHNIFYSKHSVLVSIPALSDSASRPCVPLLHANVSLPPTQVFRMSPNYSTALMLGYNCTLPSWIEKNNHPSQHVVGCSIGNAETGTVLAAYGDVDTESEASTQCNYSVVLPVQSYWKGSRDINAAVRGGFLMDWTASDCSECEISGGKCGINFTTLRFQCYCPDRPHVVQCSVDGNSDQSLKIGLGMGFGGLTILLLVVAFLIIRYKSPRAFSMYRSKQKSDTFQKTEEEWGNVHLEIPIFTVGELEEATKFFDSERELGDGGFGTVYYGKLRDGREVAVKRLYEHSYRRMKQFITEVQILTRLRHRNLVSLYGCSPRKSRELMLVYEYIPNGTVSDHLHGHLSKQGGLPWHVRMSIAVKTAQALAYLHASDIVHRDVKTDNILLDNNFEVKVADFGLSRLFPTDVSHVSTAPQGTPGYVDPEYYLCYQLTEKSDVYSFGVVLVELLSSMPAVDITRDRHEINLSSFATSKIQERELGQLVDVNLGFGSDPDVSRMVVLVAELAFRCLQQEKEMRPTMEDVVKELEAIASMSASKGSIEIVNAYKNPCSATKCNNLRKDNLNPSPVSVTETLSSCGGRSSSLLVIASGGDMATLEKFRLLATQCGVAPSPTCSPTTSPLVHVRRQKTTLWMLFSWNALPRSRDKPVQTKEFGSELTGNSSKATLKDLFESSPSFEQSDSEVARKSDVNGGGGSGWGSVMVGPGSPRPGFMGLRYRALLRKAWRPMLETILE